MCPTNGTFCTLLDCLETQLELHDALKSGVRVGTEVAWKLAMKTQRTHFTAIAFLAGLVALQGLILLAAPRQALAAPGIQNIAFSGKLSVSPLDWTYFSSGIPGYLNVMGTFSFVEKGASQQCNVVMQDVDIAKQSKEDPSVVCYFNFGQIRLEPWIDAASAFVHSKVRQCSDYTLILKVSFSTDGNDFTPLGTIQNAARYHVCPRPSQQVRR